MKVDPVGANLLTLDGQDWKDRRAKLTPMFSSGKIKMMFELSEIKSSKFVEILQREAETPVDLEMREWLQRFTTDNIGNIAFGIEPNCLDDKNSEFGKHVKTVTNISLWTIMTVIFGTEWPDLARKLGLGFIPKSAGDFFLNAFIQTIDYREKNQINRNDYVSLLLGLKDVYTKSELAAEAFIAFFGGLETSSTVMTFILYELAVNPEIQERLREELTAGMNGKLTYDTLFGFKYLDMVVNEGLRKYPPIATPLRKATKDYQIPGTDLTIPKGTVILINAYSFQHDEEYFPDPERFDPERFSDENVRNIKPFTNIPFGDGPRSCIGSRLGIMQTKLGIAKLIKNFKFQPCDKTRIPVKLVPSSPLLAPEGGMWLKVERI